MTKKTKKGFTIVELVVVIAVIAILSAVLIPTFVNLIHKAEFNNDKALVRNINTTLAISAAGEDGEATMYDTLVEVQKNGYVIENLTPRSSGSDIVWDAEHNQFVLVYKEGNATKTYTGTGFEPNMSKKENLWKIYSTVPAKENQDYSIYLKGEEYNTAVEVVGVGFDAGKNTTIPSVSYSNTGAAKDVTIRTKGGELKINAPLDTVNHYGEANVVNVIDCYSHSFHEYGTVPFMQIASGRIVLESSAKVSAIHVNTEATVNEDGTVNYSGTTFATDIVLDIGTKEVQLSRDSIGTDVGSTAILVCEVVTENADEYIWLVGNGTIEDAKVYVTETAAAPNTAVASTTTTENASDAAKAIANNAVLNEDGSVKKDEHGNTVVEDAGKDATDVKNQVVLFEGGDGTETNPLLIASGNQWYNLISTHDNEYIGIWNGTEFDTMYVSIIGDLDMTDYSLIDFVSYPYNLHVNGNGHKFTNLDSTVWGYYGYYYGHCVLENIVVEDSYAKYSIFGYGPYESTAIIDVTNVTIRNSEAYGGMFMYYTNSAKVNFEGCVVESSLVHGPGNMGGGGYVGNGQGITINNCKFGGSVVAESTNIVAGFVGQGVAVITNSEITLGSVIRSIATNGQVAAYDGQGGGAREGDNNTFNGLLSCDNEDKAKKQNSGATWIKYTGLNISDFQLAEDGTISFVGEDRNFSKVTISEYLFQRSAYYSNGNSGHDGKNAYYLGGYSCYWEDLISVDVTSNTLYKVDRVTNIVNVMSNNYVNKIACATTEVPDVEWTRYNSYLDRENGVLYYDGRTEGDVCYFIGEVANVTADGTMTPLENPYGDFNIVIKAYDDNGGIVGSVTLSYRVYFETANV